MGNKYVKDVVPSGPKLCGSCLDKLAWGIDEHERCSWPVCECHCKIILYKR